MGRIIKKKVFNLDIEVNHLSHFIIQLHFFTIFILTSYLSGTQPSLIKIINSSYEQQKISFDTCIRLIENYSNTYIHMKDVCDTNNQFLPLLNSEEFLKNFEWGYIPHITDNIKFFGKLIDQNTNKPNEFKKHLNCTVNLKMIFYPMLLVTESRFKELFNYYETLKDNELLTLSYNYEKLAVFNCNIPNPFKTDNSQCSLQYFTLLTLTKRILRCENFTPIIKNVILGMFFCNGQRQFRPGYIDNIMPKILQKNEFKHLKHYPNSYIEDMLLHIICTLYDEYRITIQNDGYLDLSNLDLNKHTLKSLYSIDIRSNTTKPFIKWEQLSHRLLQHIRHRASIEGCWGTGAAVVRAINYIYCAEITVINLAQNPKLKLSHILKLLNVFPNIKKIIIDPSVMYNSINFIEKTKINNTNYGIYYHHLTQDRKIYLYNSEEQYYALLPKEPLSIELSEESQEANKILKNLYQKAFFSYLLKFALLQSKKCISIIKNVSGILLICCMLYCLYLVS